MIDLEQRAAAAKFAEDWHERGNEKSDTQSFWLSLLARVFGVRDVEAFIQFEKSVERLGHAGYIDAYIPSTKVLIEQKSLGIDLDKAYTQAKEYADNLPLSEKPRWIVVSDFTTFRVHDMEKPLASPEVIELKNLAKEAHRLKFLVDTGIDLVKREEEISLAAGRIIGELYDAFLKLYGDNPTEADLKNLNILCVRIVFCLYAEDAGILPKNAFYNYLNKFISSDIRVAMRDFFETLNTKSEARDRFLDPDLARLPYVNGGLFDGAVSIPPFSTEMRQLLLEKASLNFDWSAISPTIFGAVFESTLNPETRRKGGMHYTSIENIHKVIDPLFLDALRREFGEIINPQITQISQMGNDTPKNLCQSVKSVDKPTRARLLAFQQKLASLTFLDPACGSGNFLTETYLSLRRLENEVLRILLAGQSELDLGDLVRVNIHQFYGIEINDFAVTVAKTALWIAESQMLKETEDILHRSLDFLPLKTYSNIVEANALTLDWETVVPRARLTYIIGNPPFVGARMMAQGSEQKRDVERIFGDIPDVQDLDYVCCWYKLAARHIQGTNIRCAFVSTNSICQGSQVPILWNVLLNECGIHINFAWQTFVWNSESTDQAHVHCVIVGFSNSDDGEKVLFTPCKTIVRNISPYLTEGDDVFVTASKNALCSVPKMNMGNMERGNGKLFLSEAERDDVLSREPELAKWIHPLIGAEELIKGKKRWCFWLEGISPEEIKQSRILYERVQGVKEFRLASNAKTTRAYATIPHLFAQRVQPKTSFIAIPVVSSENRRYVPMAFLSADNVPTTQVQILPEATLYHFGVLTSSVHMAWMRAVAGRLEMRYRYSKEIVYNNFPWPESAQSAKSAGDKITQTAQAILDARALYPHSSLAALYDEATMPIELRKAHRANDRAVMSAYGLDPDTAESEIVAELMKRYQALVSEERR